LVGFSTQTDESRLDHKIIVDGRGCCQQLILRYAAKDNGVIQTVDSHWGLSTVVAQSVDRLHMAVDSGNPRVGCCAVCRQALLVVNRHVFWAIFKSSFLFELRVFGFLFFVALCLY